MGSDIIDVGGYIIAAGTDIVAVGDSTFAALSWVDILTLCFQDANSVAPFRRDLNSTRKGIHIIVYIVNSGMFPTYLYCEMIPEILLVTPYSLILDLA